MIVNCLSSPRGDGRARNIIFGRSLRFFSVINGNVEVDVGLECVGGSRGRQLTVFCRRQSLKINKNEINGLG